MKRAGGLTFAVVGHNEANRLHVALSQALDAAGPGDHVWFVDSASTDNSGARAAALGAEVIDAPIGKGRAMAVALERCRTPYICFVDGDLECSDANVFGALRAGVEATDADMIVGDLTEPRRRRLLSSGLYDPLINTLFSDVHPALGRPLSGQRALRVGFPCGSIPPGYGVEAHLNLHVVLAGGAVADWPIGWFDSPLRDYHRLVPLSADVARAILDVAHTWGRLTSVQRREWDTWLERVLDAVRQATDDHYDATLERMAAVPMPGREPSSR